MERCPRKGEWYLKGGEKLEAFKATEDLGVKYPIAGLAITQPTHERLVIRLLAQENVFNVPHRL